MTAERLPRRSGRGGRHAAAAILSLCLLCPGAPAGAEAGEAAPPYRYEARQAAVSAETAALAALAGGGAEPRALALVAAQGGRELVRLEALDLPDGARVVTGWENRLAEPVLRSDIRPAEELALAEALRRHLPEGAVVLALPELSRRLERLTTGLSLPLARAPGHGLLHLPGPWQADAGAIAAAEAGGAAPDEAAEALWREVVEALLAPPVAGLDRLAATAGGGEPHLVLHLRDAFHLGLAARGRLPMALRDLPGSGAHDGARQVRAWMQEQGHAAFAVQRRASGALRVHFLTDPADRETLVAQLLPFNTARIGRIEGARLVFQHGGYWVYRIAPAPGEAG